MATGHAQDQRDVYAVVRLDSHRNFTPRPDYVTVKKVVSSLAEAELEVRALNGLAPTGTVYFLQRTTVALENRPAQPVRVDPDEHAEAGDHAAGRGRAASGTAAYSARVRSELGQGAAPA